METNAELCDGKDAKTDQFTPRNPNDIEFTSDQNALEDKSKKTQDENQNVARKESYEEKSMSSVRKLEPDYKLEDEDLNGIFELQSISECKTCTFTGGFSFAGHNFSDHLV